MYLYVGINNEIIIGLLEECGNIRYEIIPHNTKVFTDGKWLHITNNPNFLVNQLKNVRLM